MSNLADTGFYIKKEGQIELRWFTPTTEVDLCGHATLAAAYVLFHHENHPGNIIRFYSPGSGQLTVTKDQDYLTLNFPADQYEEINITTDIIDCFDLQPMAAFKGKTDYLLVFENENDITTIHPRPDKITQLKARGVISTARVI